MLERHPRHRGTFLPPLSSIPSHWYIVLSVWNRPGTWEVMRHLGAPKCMGECSRGAIIIRRMSWAETQAAGLAPGHSARARQWMVHVSARREGVLVQRSAAASLVGCAGIRMAETVNWAVQLPWAAHRIVHGLHRGPLCRGTTYISGWENKKRAI
ncbi:hypothetical protein BGZ61DRAFT_477425 [Ilyonectria robusta]|uniref:uncharacterized protein n=1 Tax=Ilyonectria robusta TaxID=1079257 RepID=UPI001E8CD421|nr:uncharacterized protein BGZ61DRAFT_477425 [Ilyonectria robusta]KAH8706816.1 hypothetical protein BGZ61DRAFT_477425 [Ilyonectria robusta]